MTKEQTRFDHTKDTPYLALTGQLCGAYCEYFQEKLEQLERSEDTPHRLMITHTIESHWIPSQKKTKSKIRQNFIFLNFKHALQHSGWTPFHPMYENSTLCAKRFVHRANAAGTFIVHQANAAGAFIVHQGNVVEHFGSYIK